MAEVIEGIDSVIHFQDDISSLAAVSSVRPPSRNIFFPAERNAAVAAFSLGLAACGGGGGASVEDLDSARTEATSTINSLPSLTESDKEEFSMQLSSAADKESIDRIVADARSRSEEKAKE